MVSRKITAVLTALTLWVAGAVWLVPATAQELDPQALELARVYVDMTDKALVYEATVVASGVQTKKTILRTNPELADVTSEVIGEVIKTYADRKTELTDRFARIYAALFNAEELQAIIDFYSTDVGKKLIASNRTINDRLNETLKVFRANLRREFYAKVRAGMKEKGYDI